MHVYFLYECQLLAKTFNLPLAFIDPLNSQIDPWGERAMEGDRPGARGVELMGTGYQYLSTGAVGDDRKTYENLSLPICTLCVWPLGPIKGAQKCEFSYL